MKPDLHEPGPAAARRRRREDDARAYARLLLSDIRLYNEEDVILGRMNADISRRLGAQIERARALYRRRFQDEAPFDREIVSTLAGGDRHRLG